MLPPPCGAVPRLPLAGPTVPFARLPSLTVQSRFCAFRATPWRSLWRAGGVPLKP